MCEFSANLVAWLDAELGTEEAAVIGRHVQKCSECRERANLYASVTRAFDVLCDRAVSNGPAPAARRAPPIWAPVLAGAIALAVAMVFFYPHWHRAKTMVSTPKGPVAPTRAIAPPARLQIAQTELPAASRRHSPLRHVPQGQQARVRSARDPILDAAWSAAAPAIEITIPAEAVLPPGAAPAGATFVADVAIGSDGSAQQLRLRPY